MTTLSAAVAAYASRCVRDGDCLVANTRRYGDIFSDQGRMSAHRAAYIAVNGPIPDGLMVRHKCDRKNCVEPTHLEVGTGAQNERDKRRQGRRVTRNAGEANASAHLTRADVVALRREARTGASIRDIAAARGLPYSRVRSAVRGQTWALVTEEPPVPNNYRWSKPSPRRLPADARATSLALAADGLTLEEIARALGCARLTAWRLTQGGEA